MQYHFKVLYYFNEKISKKSSVYHGLSSHLKNEFKFYNFFFSNFVFPVENSKHQLIFLDFSENNWNNLYLV